MENAGQNGPFACGAVFHAHLSSDHSGHRIAMIAVPHTKCSSRGICYLGVLLQARKLVYRQSSRVSELLEFAFWLTQKFSRRKKFFRNSESSVTLNSVGSKSENAQRANNNF